jgi:hypothetical protein
MLKLLAAEYATYDADLDQKLVENLSAGQLHAYLVAEKAFPRPEIHVPVIEEDSEAMAPTPITGAASGLSWYCGVCGLNVLFHPPTLHPLDIPGFACLPISTSQRPGCDVGLWTTLRPSRDTIQHINPIRGLITTLGTRASLRGASQLVECASPHMTIALHALTTFWGLKTFDYSARRRKPAATLDSPHVIETQFPLALLGVDASHVDRTLAPHALLALVSEIFIKRLVREALRARVEMLRAPAGMIGPTVLTTAHISRALMGGRGAEGWLPLMAVARIGILHTENV